MMARPKAQGPGSKVQGPRSKVQGPRSKVQGPRSKVQRWRPSTTNSSCAESDARRSRRVPMLSDPIEEEVLENQPVVLWMPAPRADAADWQIVDSALREIRRKRSGLD